MAIIGTCINCLPAPTSFAITAFLAVAALTIAIYRTARRHPIAEPIAASHQGSPCLESYRLVNKA
jgi:hypothetical protein